MASPAETWATARVTVSDAAATRRPAPGASAWETDNLAGAPRRLGGANAAYPRLAHSSNGQSSFLGYAGHASTRATHRFTSGCATASRRCSEKESGSIRLWDVPQRSPSTVSYVPAPSLGAVCATSCADVQPCIRLGVSRRSGLRDSAWLSRSM